MSLVFDKHEIEMKPLHDLLRENKMNFTQFLRTVNFVRDMTQEQLNDYIEAYKNGEIEIMVGIESIRKWLYIHMPNVMWFYVLWSKEHVVKHYHKK